MRNVYKTTILFGGCILLRVRRWIKNEQQSNGNYGAEHICNSLSHQYAIVRKELDAGKQRHHKYYALAADG